MSTDRRTRVRGVDSTIDEGINGFRPIPADQPKAGATLGELIRFFITKPSPAIIVSTFVGGVVARIAIGRWGWWDVAIPAIVIGLEPFVEWVLHVHLLHRRPTKLGRWTIDPINARKHREHHRNPKDLRIVMVPFQALFPAGPLLVALAVWQMDPPQAAMSIACGFGMLGWYEWAHYLMHAPYRPKSQWFRNVSRNHVLHHFKNEHYWFGVTTSIGDRVLGTRPDGSTIPVSPTVRTLGVDLAADVASAS
jgi:sterol desaturase/sphingolipid hydroxylase (fatty acid hydroxylase superfamily)